MTRSLSVEEVSKHSTLEDLWVVVDGNVYDLTEFAPDHPGGAEIILCYAGRDATIPYSEIHAPSLIKTSLPTSKHLGDLDSSTITSLWTTSPPSSTSSSSPIAKPPLDALINTHDFELVASRTLSPKAWAFYSSAATDLHTKHRNSSTFASITLRPRVLIDVHACTTTTTMLSHPISAPLFCAPVALAKLAHPAGELELTRGLHLAQIPHCISTGASYPVADIFSAAHAQSQTRPYLSPVPFFFQLYVDRNRSKSEQLLAHVQALGAKAIFVTVDAAVSGKREADERVRADEGLAAPMSGAKAKNDSKGGSLGRIMAGFIDSSLSWSDIAWLRAHTSLPLVLKGIQTAMDARLAMEAGVEGIVISNHGGRNLDTSPVPILVLLEMQKCCPEVFDRLEVYVDGGVTRGTDVFKLVCLGARAVGVGRGSLYALNYGKKGVEKYFEILRDELLTTMRLCGLNSLSQAHPGLLNTLAVDHLVPSRADHLYAKWSRSAGAKAKI